MGLHYTTCLEPNDPGNDLNDKLVYKASELSAEQSYYEYNSGVDDDSENDSLDGIDENDVNINEDSIENSQDNDNVVDSGTIYSHGTSSSGSPGIRTRHRIRRRRSSQHPCESITGIKPFYRRHHRYNHAGQAITYACAACLTHVSASNLIISDRYRGASGDALLIYDVVNADCGSIRTSRMTTGTYTVCDLRCRQCGHYLGWKYVTSSEESQKFKEGRYILELELITELRS